ncbi:MAG: glycosyltransferase [Myxococcales bacterium]|nr:glycosyltransferase [Myxococcales bacterium]
MEFTGERLVPDDPAQRDLYWEHLARYRLAAPFAAGKRVLDLGCGCGYGADLFIAAGAVDATALDNSREAIEYARAHYADPRLRFLVGEARRTELPDASFDLIVCFELIEHLAEPETLAAEIRRLLAPDGLAFVSTPNADRPAKTPNPWHVREFRRDEFAALLQSHFARVQLLGQRRFSGMLFAADRPTEAVTAAPESADYWIAVCGQQMLPEAARLIEIPYWQNLNDLRAHLAARDGEMADREQRILALQREVEEKTRWGTELDRRARELAEQVQNRNVRLVLTARERDQARAGWGYRLQTALAPVGALLRRLGRGIGRASFFFFRLIVELLGWLPTTLRLIGRMPRFWRAWFVAGRCRKRLDNVPSPAPIALPPLTSRPGPPPGLSVVIPTFNGHDLLAEHLPSVLAEAARCPFPVEILVVDDGGTDQTPDWLAATHPQIRVVHSAANEGFAAAANRGVREATRPVVYLCNNDMELLPGALERSARTLWETGAFAVASAIAMTDAAKADLETGFTVGHWTGGRLHLTHRHEPGETPRSILYAGGGSSAFDREAFLALGGFRSMYHPFYFEDVDLSFRAWRAGYEVLFEPRSRARHRHRGTIDRVASPAEIDAIFERNRLLFTWSNLRDETLWKAHWRSLPAAVWRGKISAKAFAAAIEKLPEAIAERGQDGPIRRADPEIFQAGSRVWDLRRWSQPAAPRLRPKVLALAPYCPYPPSHGGAVRMWELLTRLAATHEIHLAAMVERDAELAAREELEKYFPRVHLHRRGAPDVAPLWWPASVAEFASEDFARAIDRLAGEEDYDLIQVEYPILAHFLPTGVRAKKVISEIDVYHVAYQRAAELQRWPARLPARYEMLRMFRYEAEAAARADLLLAMSEADAASCRRLSSTPVRVAPNGVDTKRFAFLPRRPGVRELLFVGNFRHPPNADGISWFAREVWPRVRDAEWSARLIVAGADPPAEVRRLANDPTIRVTGFVADLRPLWAECAGFIAPIRRGSGTRLKILEAMAAGAPVISTTVGSEGLAVENGRHLLLADDPADFARACLRLLHEPETAARLAGEARRLVEMKYDWDAIAAQLARTWREAIG